MPKKAKTEVKQEEEVPSTTTTTTVMEVDEQKPNIEDLDLSVVTVGGNENEREEYEHLCTLVNPIAKPLASRKLAKKLYKLVRKSSKAEKGSLKQGLTDVVKAIRRDEQGLVILAGNVSPIDVYSHIPALCEEKSLGYVFTPSREHLGLAGGHKRPAIVLMVKRQEAYDELYDQCQETISQLVVEEWSPPIKEEE